MAKIKRPKWGTLAATIRTRIETKALYDALSSEEFIVNIYDGGKGGIVKKMSADPWLGLMGAVGNTAQPGVVPYVNGYYVTLEGETGDIAEFVNNTERTEIGVGTFAQGAAVYGVIGADLKVTITDVPAAGRVFLGTVEVPLVVQGDIKIVYVSLVKSGSGFTTIDKVAKATLSGTLNTATEANIVTGGKTVIITLAGDTFIAADGAASKFVNATALKFINGIVNVSGDDNLASIKTALVAAAAGGENTAIIRTSATVVTITLPAVAAFSIAADEVVAVTVHEDLLESSSTPLLASPSATIVAS